MNISEFFNELKSVEIPRSEGLKYFKKYIRILALTQKFEYKYRSDKPHLNYYCIKLKKWVVFEDLVGITKHFRRHKNNNELEFLQFFNFLTYKTLENQNNDKLFSLISDITIYNEGCKKFNSLRIKWGYKDMNLLQYDYLVVECLFNLVFNIKNIKL